MWLAAEQRWTFWSKDFVKGSPFINNSSSRLLRLVQIFRGYEGLSKQHPSKPTLVGKGYSTGGLWELADAVAWGQCSVPNADDGTARLLQWAYQGQAVIPGLCQLQIVSHNGPITQLPSCPRMAKWIRFFVTSQTATNQIRKIKLLRTVLYQVTLDCWR